MRSTMTMIFLAVACAPDDGETVQVQPPEPIPEGWAALVSYHWALAPTTERYWCVRKTVTEDTYLAGVQALSPLGTHHSVLTVGAPSGGDGAEPCTGLDNHRVMLYGAGIHTNPIEFPPGVAMRIRAGQQLLLNLHLLNSDTDGLTGDSGILYKLIDAADIESEALLAGQVSGLVIPTGVSTITGNCPMYDTTSIFSVGPHMHQLGTHMRITANTANGPVTLHDGAFDFGLQLAYPLDPPQPIAPGDSITVACTYNNTTGHEVRWGESSYAEMCFASLFFTSSVTDDLSCAE